MNIIGHIFFQAFNSNQSYKKRSRNLSILSHLILHLLVQTPGLVLDPSDSFSVSYFFLGLSSPFSYLSLSKQFGIPQSLKKFIVFSGNQLGEELSPKIDYSSSIQIPLFARTFVSSVCPTPNPTTSCSTILLLYGFYGENYLVW